MKISNFRDDDIPAKKKTPEAWTAVSLQWHRRFCFSRCIGSVALKINYLYHEIYNMCKIKVSRKHLWPNYPVNVWLKFFKETWIADRTASIQTACCRHRFQETGQSDGVPRRTRQLPPHSESPGPWLSPEAAHRPDSGPSTSGWPRPDCSLRYGYSYRHPPPDEPYSIENHWWPVVKLFFSRNIASVTPKNIYFHYKRKVFLGSKYLKHLI